MRTATQFMLALPLSVLLSLIATQAVAADAPSPASPVLAASAPMVSSAPSPSETATSNGALSDELGGLQARIQVLEAQRKIAELNKAIRDANGAASAGGQSSPPVALNGALPASTATSTPSAAIVSKPSAAEMQVLTITAFDGRYRALLDNGSRQQDVQVGDTVAGWLVTRITEHTVELARGKGRQARKRVVDL